MSYFYSGFPYSDELYHHGIKGQRWGIRRYQNEDGSLTAAGKIRYGAQKVGETLGSGLKALGSHVGDRIKAKHKWMMSDEELQDRIQRLEMEKRYKDLLRDSKPSMSRGKKIVGDILESGVKTLANRAVDEFADKLFEVKGEETLSSKVKKDFEKKFKDTYKNGSGALPDYKDVEKMSNYLEKLRLIEGSNKGSGGGGKQGKQNKGKK